MAKVYKVVYGHKTEFEEKLKEAVKENWKPDSQMQVTIDLTEKTFKFTYHQLLSKEDWE